MSPILPQRKEAQAPIESQAGDSSNVDSNQDGGHLFTWGYGGYLGFELFVELPTRQEDPPLALQANKPDVGPNAHDFPFHPPTRMLLAKADNVTHLDFYIHSGEL